MTKADPLVRKLRSEVTGEGKLGLRLRRRQVARLDLVLEVNGFVGAVPLRLSILLSPLPAFFTWTYGN